MEETSDKEEDKQLKDGLNIYLMKRVQIEASLCVVYNPDCGCPLDQFVILDRFPLSKKIHFVCPGCKKRCLLEISSPVRFHSPLTGEDFSLKRLKKMFVCDTWQKDFIKLYQQISVSRKEKSRV